MWVAYADTYLKENISVVMALDCQSGRRSRGRFSQRTCPQLRQLQAIRFSLLLVSFVFISFASHASTRK